MKHIMCSNDLTTIDEYPYKDYYTDGEILVVKDAVMKTYYCAYCKIIVKKMHTL